MVYPNAVYLVATLVAVGVLAWIVRHWMAHSRNRALDRAKKQFHLRREWLEAKFLDLVANSGKPRGLAWDDCDFDHDVRFARDRGTGQLRALIGVTVRFRAIEGGGMEDNENVGNLRAATAVFDYQNATWTTGGRAVFNLSPAQTIERFQHELETAE